MQCIPFSIENPEVFEDILLRIMSCITFLFIEKLIFIIIMTSKTVTQNINRKMNKVHFKDLLLLTKSKAFNL